MERVFSKRIDNHRRIKEMLVLMDRLVFPLSFAILSQLSSVNFPIQSSQPYVAGSPRGVIVARTEH